MRTSCIRGCTEAGGDRLRRCCDLVAVIDGTADLFALVRSPPIAREVREALGKTGRKLGVAPVRGAEGAKRL